MSEFIFMLTHHDMTVPDCLAVYEQIRGSEVRWVGFKDVGVPPGTLRELAARIRDDGRSVVLEVVSIDRESELRSLATGLDIGVNLLMGGTNVTHALPLLAGSGVRYFPFPGRIVGHPSVLEGTVEEIAASARELAARPGVNGLDLLAYRHAGDVPHLVEAVVSAAGAPVVAAGSIDSSERIGLVSRLGCWAFTVGGAVFERRFPGDPGPRAQVDTILRMSRAAEATLA